MKQSSTTNKTRGRKASGSSNSKTQHKTGSRQSSARETSPRSNGSSATAGSSSQRSSTSSSSKEGQRSQSGNFQGSSHLEKFFLDQLKDIYYAEHKIVDGLGKMQEAATTEELKEAFEDHLYQTQRHIKRLEKVFETLGKEAEGEKCEAIEGIARELDTIIEETEEGTLTRDAALIIAAQKVEHYEIATYGGLVQLAITMELHDAADLLDKTLIEEEDTDALLTEIAENEINLGAECEGNQYSWQQEQGMGMKENEKEEGEEETSTK